MTSSLSSYRSDRSEISNTVQDFGKSSRHPSDFTSPLAPTLGIPVVAGAGSYKALFLDVRMLTQEP